MPICLEIKQETQKEDFVGNDSNNDGIVYSPNKYRETEGSKDIGTNFWNQGRTEEIKDRVLHIDW